MQINPKLYTWQIILNPNSLLHKSRIFWEHIENKLKESKIGYICNETKTVEEVKELISNLCKKGKRHFIIVGGDGTLNVFVNAVMESNINTREIFAASIPLGTGNDWSRTHIYPTKYIQTIDLFLNGNFIAHDIGLVETIINEKVTDARYFVNIAGFGFDGAVIANTKKKPVKIFNKQLYLIHLFRTLLKYKSQIIELRTENSTITKNILTIAAGIGQYNGNGMRQCPYAITNDGLLDIVTIENVSVFKVLMNIKKLFKGTHLKKLKEVSMIMADYLEINTSPYIYGEVDGELLSVGNYRIRCFSGCINFMSNLTPLKNEQQKIATCLSSLDDLITAQQKT